MSSKRHLRRKECEGKKIYRDRVLDDGTIVTAVQQASYDVRMMLRHRGEHCHVYRCRQGHVHVGHHTRQNKQAYAARYGMKLR